MARRPSRLDQIAKMTVDQRLSLSREKADKLVDQCIQIERIRANNRHLIFRDVFEGNLHHTFAGNAYESLRLTSFSFEVVRLMALWDKPAENVFSIPEVMALIADPAVIAQARSECIAEYGSEYVPLRRSAERRFDRGLRHAQILASVLPTTHRFKSLKRHRNKFYAHNLNDATISPKFGYERKLLWSSERIVNALRGVLSSAGLDFRETRALCERHADEFWHGVKWEKPESA
jgi:hypothetical protein